MQRLYRRALVGLALMVATTGVVSFSASTPSGATTNPGGPTPSEDTPGGDPFDGLGSGNQNSATQVVTISATTISLPTGSEGSSDSGCANSSVTVYVADDFADPVTTDFFLADAIDGSTLTSFWFTAAQGRGRGVRLFSPTGRWFGAFCDGDLAFVPEGGPAVSIGGLVQRVVDQLDPPDPLLEVTPHHGKHAVRMQSWLAVDPIYWSKTREASASSGRVTVTAWLEAFEALWDMGNGDVQPCDNPGVVWRKGMDDSVSTCDYTYTWPSVDSPTKTYDLTGTVRFNVEFTTNAPGTYGPFTPVERTTTETIEVVEIQSVGT